MAEDTLELAHRYAQLVDDRRFDELHRVLAPEIRISGPGYVMQGLAEVQGGMEILRRYERTFHFVGNQLGQWDAENAWSGETYCIASHVYRRDGAEWKLDMAIRYQDRIERANGGLRFIARELRLAWLQDLPLALAAPAPP
jgi:hypothetical protein